MAYTVLKIYAVTVRSAEWKRMRDIYLACQRAAVEIPAVVQKYFAGQTVDDKDEEVVEITDDRTCVRLVVDGSDDQYDIDVSRLPRGITIVRVVCEERHG